MRILGNQPEPSLVEFGMTISDFEVRTKSVHMWNIGQDMIDEYIAANPVLAGSGFAISDPMTVGIYPSKAEAGEFNFDELVLKLEALGFYGKSAGYYTPQQSFNFS
jgi:hypothetical protein